MKLIEIYILLLPHHLRDFWTLPTALAMNRRLKKRGFDKLFFRYYTSDLQRVYQIWAWIVIDI
jgi:transposase